MKAQEMEKLLLQAIPISRAMQVSVKELSEDSLKLFVPLRANHNHKGTLFGGSAYSAAALACYGLFLSGLRDHGLETNNVVASEGHIHYREPVDSDCMIHSAWSSAEDKQEFFKSLARWKKARTEMKAQIYIQGKVCAEFSAHFVAKL